MTPRTLESSIEHFLLTLSDEDRVAITTTLPSFRVGPARDYIDRIVQKYELAKRDSELVRDINAKIDREMEFEWPTYYQDDGLFEASMIYKAAYKRLREP